MKAAIFDEPGLANLRVYFTLNKFYKPNLIHSSSDKSTSSAILLNTSSDLLCPRISVSLPADLPSKEYSNLISIDY